MTSTEVSPTSSEAGVREATYTLIGTPAQASWQGRSASPQAFSQACRALGSIAMPRESKPAAATLMRVEPP